MNRMFRQHRHWLIAKGHIQEPVKAAGPQVAPAVLLERAKKMAQQAQRQQRRIDKRVAKHASYPQSIKPSIWPDRPALYGDRVSDHMRQAVVGRNDPVRPGHTYRANRRNEARWSYRHEKRHGRFKREMGRAVA
jgi:hypothetical protein